MRAADTQRAVGAGRYDDIGDHADERERRWNASTDNVGVTGYSLYRNGAKAGSTTATSYTFTGLACGTTYTLALTAYDAAGNESAPSIDHDGDDQCVQPAAGATRRRRRLRPGSRRPAARRNVDLGRLERLDRQRRRDRLRRLSNGTTRAAAASSTSYTYSGLACGTSYTLAVDAVDAAGNRSAKSSITASTAACRRRRTRRRRRCRPV